jgi:hypothetical protein
MHAMYSPEDRYRMKHYVLQIDREIENQERDHNREKTGNCRKVHQSPTVLFGLEGEADDPCRQN